MNILVLNCGSSSIKFQLVDMNGENILMKGLYERVGTDGAVLTVKYDDKKEVVNEPALDHLAGINVIFNQLLKVVDSLDEINGIGHRIVHGGDKYSESVLVTEDVKKEIEKCAKLSPLHNKAGLSGILACEELNPNIKNVVVFDTAFHQTMSDFVYMYPIPYSLYEKHKIRKYGFHGTSHRYVANRVSELLNKDDLKIINCHIGQGASICAIKNGKSVETSMGFTPLEGLLMGTRSGSLDPAIVGFLAAEENMTPAEVIDVLNKKSGLLGVSEISGDSRDIEAAVEKGDKKAILVSKMESYIVAKTIASYLPILGGLDVLTFTAGSGENNKLLRQRVCEYLKFIGVELDLDLNDTRSDERVISAKDSKVTVMIVPTDEEIVIARDTKNIIEG